MASISKTGIIIHYNDGEVKGYELGRRFGESGGLTFPHEVISELHVGQEIKEGDVISYNSGFFEKDILNKNNLVWKSGTLIKTALMESTHTLEDSSAITNETAKLLTTKMTKTRTIVVSFTQSVRKLISVGDEVNPDTILCIIEDAVTASSNLFDEQSLDTLRLLSAQTPQAKFKGVVERIDVYYHGDKDDMSESLRELAINADNELRKRHKSFNSSSKDGSVDDDYRIEGDPLVLDTMAIKIYISADVPAIMGDKVVFANQMKSVIGDIIEKEITTESGEKIGAIFGATSIYNRIVLSPFIQGTTITLLDVVAKKAIAAYKS